MAENFANMKEDEYDVFGKFMATELRNITNKVLYQETKWKLIQVVMEGVRKQLAMNVPCDLGPSTSTGSSRSLEPSTSSQSGSGLDNDHNYYYSGVNMIESDEQLL